MTQSVVSVVRAPTDWTPCKPVCVDLDGTLSPYHPLWHGPGRCVATMMYVVPAFISSLWRLKQPVYWPVWYEATAHNPSPCRHGGMSITGSMGPSHRGSDTALDTGASARKTTMDCYAHSARHEPCAHDSKIDACAGAVWCDAGHGQHHTSDTSSRSMWAGFKGALSMYGPMHGAGMQYRTRLVDMVAHWHKINVPVYLVTGSPWRVAYSVYMQHGFFDGFLSSNCAVHLVGRAKARALVHRWGKQGFHYIGDSWTDRHVWNECAEIITVAAPTSRLVDHLCGYKGTNQQVYCIDG